MRLKTKLSETPEITSRGGSLNILISPKTVDSHHLVMGFSQVGPDDVIRPHIHDYSEEAFYVIEGQGRLYFSEQEYVDFEAGEAVLVPKGRTHWIKNTGAFPMKVIFAVSPLAPSPDLGHREVQLQQEFV